ncbi:MAG: hypothetical protein DI598_19305 [Pseudopedobacter saltans]|uniref:Thioredoxin domain-containing protein n=1 Tax=Pseudopedobacter saltans TaxID=151895 RepID=A0A2W5EG06_9SPHI|nr:MAG: hypothetical protein DI598_19305 [Pseudopedobacter saltans]
MKLKTLVSVSGTFLSIFSTDAQGIRPLQIGDTVPDLLLHNIVNYRDTTVKISEFKGKLLILHFWATWCTTCIATFPHNKEMAEHYGNRIQVLNVGFEPKEKIMKFLSGLESRMDTELPATNT